MKFFGAGTSFQYVPVSVTHTSEMPARAMENLCLQSWESPLFRKSLKRLLSYCRTENFLKLQEILWEKIPAKARPFHTSSLPWIRHRLCRGQLDLQLTFQLSKNFASFVKLKMHRHGKCGLKAISSPALPGLSTRNHLRHSPTEGMKADEMGENYFTMHCCLCWEHRADTSQADIFIYHLPVISQLKRCRQETAQKGSAQSIHL